MKVRYTVPSDVSRISYVGNGSTQVFPIPFVFFDDTDIQVTLVNSTTAAETPQVLTTNFTVSGGEGETGSVTMLVAPATGYNLVIVRKIPYTQEIDYQANDGFPAEVTEEGFDRATMLAQQNRLEIQKSPKLPPTYDPDSDPEIRIPVPVAGQILVGKSDASGWDNAPLSDVSTAEIPAIITNLANRDLLEYDLGSLAWRNQTLATILKRMLTTAGDIAVNIAGTVSRLAIGTAGQVLGVSGGAVAWVTPTVYGYTGVRQTVQHGPVTTAGLPDFLPSTNAALSITTQNVSATYPLVASAANGSNASGAVNAIGYSAANIQWTGLTASRAAATPNFLYVVVNADGSLTPGSTILAPIYQWGGTPSTTNGQFTFNISEMRGYLGNGSTAPQTNLVFVGEAATNGTGVISSVAYAYNGRYEGAWTATLWTVSTGVSRSHNLGVLPKIKDFILECTTNDQGFVVGEQISLAEQTLTASSSGIYHPHPLATLRNTMRTFAGQAQAFIVTGATDGVNRLLTAASWKYKAMAERGW